MSGYLLSFIIGAAAVGALVWFLKADRLPGLERRFVLLHAQARIELPPEQIRALTHELAELKEIGAKMEADGVAPNAVRRMIIKAGIDSMGNHIALNRVLPG